MATRFTNFARSAVEAFCHQERKEKHTTVSNLLDFEELDRKNLNVTTVVAGNVQIALI